MNKHLHHFVPGYSFCSFWEVRWSCFYLIWCGSLGFAWPIAPMCLLVNVTRGLCLAPCTEGNAISFNAVAACWCVCGGTGLSTVCHLSSSLLIEKNIFTAVVPVTLKKPFCKLKPPRFSDVSYLGRGIYGLFLLCNGSAAEASELPQQHNAPALILGTYKCSYGKCFKHSGLLLLLWELNPEEIWHTCLDFFLH